MRVWLCKSLHGIAAIVTVVSFGVLPAQTLDLAGTLNMTPRTAVTAHGNTVYSVGNNNFAVVSVSDPADPSIVGQVSPGVPGLVSVDVLGSYAFCAGGTVGLVVIDITNPSSPAWRASLTLAAQARDADAFDTLVAVATAANISLVGVRNPAQPHLLTTLGYVASWLEFDSQGDQIYVGSASGALVLEVSTFDSAGATRYRLTEADSYGNQSMTPLDIAGQYVDYARGADLVALHRSSFTLAGSYTATSAIRAIAGGNNFCFIALATGSIQYIDQRANDPEFVVSSGLSSAATGLALGSSGGISLVVAATASGLSVFEYTPLAVDDIERPEHPREFSISGYPNPFNGLVNLNLQVTDPGEYELVIYDILGQAVSSEQLFVTSTANRTLDFVGRSSGVYFAALRGEQTQAVTKLVYVP